MTISENRIERAAKVIARVYDSEDGESWDVFASQFREAARAALIADAPELAAAEARGRIEGLREAAVYVGDTRKAFLGESAAAWPLIELTVTIDARISALSKAPTADTEIGG